MSSEPIPAWLLSPVSREHRPPVRTQARLLPFAELDPGDFERLCVALAREDGEPEACRLYGTPGQAQEGIDLYARLQAGRYATYQCKRYESVTDGDIRTAVETFREGDWLTRSERFVFCTSHAAIRTDHVEEIERQAEILRADDVVFDVWDAEELSTRLKTRPRVVLDFFGRPWVEEFCTDQLVDPHRLDAAEIARLRTRLREFYARLFARHDALIDGGAPVLERVVEPHVLRVRHLRYDRGDRQPPESGGAGDRDSRPPPTLASDEDSLVSERIRALDWIGANRRTLLLGGAGTGKSTLLRWLCLELLAEAPRTVGPPARDGAFVAVWLPFGRWVAAIGSGHRDLSLPGVLHRFFAAYAAEDLWELVQDGLRDERLVLLVDGLDEWSDEAAADIAAERLQQYLVQRSVPALAATRPEGLRVLRAVDPEWSTAELAPLSSEQQRGLLTRLGAREADATAFLAEIGGTVRLRQMATNPLLLGLMWRLRSNRITLPAGEQAVFAEFVRWLVRVQAPARRRIAEVQDPLDLDADEVEAALAALALAVQRSPSPALSIVEARVAVTTFLADGAATPMGLSEARAQARLVLEQGRGPIGILGFLDADHISFVHRALQEHLAGSALAKFASAEQEAVAAQHAADPGWRNALDALIWAAPTPSRADRLLERIVEATGAAPARWGGMPLLAQAALGTSRATRGARDRALEAACNFVESDDRLAARGVSLDILIAGLGLDSGVIARRLTGWWPCRALDRSGVLDAMHTWPVEHETVELWWRALSDEDTATARKAGALLVDRLADQPEASARLTEMLRTPLPPDTRAAALETLGRGWPNHPELARWIERGLSTPAPNLRLVALDLLVRGGRHADHHLEIALDLADGWGHIDHARGDQLAETLISGWPEHDRLRHAVVTTIDDARAERPIEIQLATWLAITCFSDDPWVQAWVRQSLHTEHPMLLLGASGWRLVGERYRDAALLVDLEALFTGDRTAREVELCELALGLKTPAAKNYLLTLLNTTNGFPSAGWPFSQLVLGWPEDPEVITELRSFVAANPLVTQVTAWIDDVMPEAEATVLLLETAGDPNNDRAGRPSPPSGNATTQLSEMRRSRSEKAESKRSRSGGIP